MLCSIHLYTFEDCQQGLVNNRRRQAASHSMIRNYTCDYIHVVIYGMTSCYKILCGFKTLHSPFKNTKTNTGELILTKAIENKILKITLTS